MPRASWGKSLAVYSRETGGGASSAAADVTPAAITKPSVANARGSGRAVVNIDRALPEKAEASGQSAPHGTRPSQVLKRTVRTNGPAGGEDPWPLHGCVGSGHSALPGHHLNRRG